MKKDGVMQQVSLPDSLRVVAEAGTALAGFTVLEDYLLELVRSDIKRWQEDPEALLRRALAGTGNPAKVREEALLQRKKAIQGLLLEGLSGGEAAPMGQADWNSLRDRVRRKLARRTA